MAQDDRSYMQRAHNLAAQALLLSDPNPRVGCVLVRDGEIVGEGWTQPVGDNHAEIEALEKAGARARGACAYITLSPCVSQGRSGSCTDALVEAGVAEVVYAVSDPGQQHPCEEILAQRGIQVRCDAFETDWRAHNPGYFARYERGTPWLRVKSAMSLDARVALDDGRSQWISGERSREEVQLWRARSSAILTGVGTVLADNPQLNVRPCAAFGDDTDRICARQPLRVVLDSRLRTPPGAKILDGGGALLVCTQSDQRDDAEVLCLANSQGGVDLPALLADLGRRGCNEVQVEAGPTLVTALLQADLVDEWVIYVAPMVLGLQAQAIVNWVQPETIDKAQRLRLQSCDKVGEDARLILHRK